MFSYVTAYSLDGDRSEKTYKWIMGNCFPFERGTGSTPPNNIQKYPWRKGQWDGCEGGEGKEGD